MGINYTDFYGKLMPLSGAAVKAFVGTNGSDIFTGTTGNDIFRGYSGPDKYAGGRGDDTYIISSIKDVIVENAGEGVDTVRSAVHYTLGANLENLTLEGAQSWYGGGNALANIITGNEYSQQIDGKGGNDLLIGGDGSDTFIISKGNGNDVIADFRSGVDNIRLADYGISSFSQVQSIAKQVGSDTVLNFSNGEALLLRNVAPSDLKATDFSLQLDTSKLQATFGDDFNSLSLLSQGGTWRTEYGHGGPGSIASHTLPGESQLYMDSAYAGTGTKALGVNPFSISPDGILTITAAPASAEVLPYLDGHTYTSGLLTSKFSFAQEYGYFEIRAALPEGQGFWPAFWLMPTDNSWPPELDVFEQLGKDANTLYMTAHDLKDGVHSYVQDRAYLDTTQFHTYGVNWNANTLTYYIDGAEVAKQATPSAMNKEMYMMMNLAVGGNWGGAPDATTGTGQMKIDYVRAYATADTVSTTINGVKTVYDTTVKAPATTPPTTTPPTTTPPTTTVPTTTAPATTTPTTPPAVTEPTLKIINGTAGADRLNGTDSNESLIGGAGNDILDGKGGANSLAGGTGDDTYYVRGTDTIIEKAGEGMDTVISTVTFTLGANLENLRLDGSAIINGTGNELANRIIGSTGANVLTGGLGADYLDGNGGRDSLVGGEGDDTYIVRDTNVSIVEKANEGTDLVVSTISFTLGSNLENLRLDGDGNLNGTGNELANRLIGNGGANILTGGAGNDYIDAGAGADTVIGGLGSDTLIGGAGKDKFQFSTGFGQDKVMDFNLSDDTLQISGYTKAQMHVTQVGANTVIDFGGADTIILMGVNAKDPALLSHIIF